MLRGQENCDGVCKREKVLIYRDKAVRGTIGGMEKLSAGMCCLLRAAFCSMSRVCLSQSHATATTVSSKPWQPTEEEEKSTRHGRAIIAS